MNRQHRVSRSVLAGRGAALRAGGFIAVMLAAASAKAVTVSGTTYAAETGGPTPNPASTSFSLTNPTAASDSIRSDVKYSHAEAWASASVTCLGVTKTTGGRGWADTPPTATAPLFDNKANLWNASASGTQVVANYTGKGTPPEFTPFDFVIPGNGVASQFNAFPGNSAGDPAELTPPSGGIGFVVNGGGGGAGTLPSFFDIFLQIDATAQQGAGQPVDLFHGTLLFDPGALTFQTTGGFAGISPIVTGSAGHYSVSFPTIQGGTFNAVVGQSFQTNFNVYMTMGDPNRQFNSADPATYPTPFDFSGMSGGAVGAVGAFASSVSVNDPSNFMVSAVPATSAASNLTWNGGGADGNWTNPANWSGGKAPVATNALTFDGGVNLATNNDFAPNTQFNGITFAPTASSFTLVGNSVVLAGDINDNSTSAQTINLPLIVNGGTSNINVASGGSLALGTVTFGAVPQASTFSALNVNNTISATSLIVQTDSPVANTINIAAGAVLNLTGATTNAVVVGTPGTSAASPTTFLTIAGGGTLNVGGASANLIVGVSGPGSNGNSNATLDMSGLANFVYNSAGGDIVAGSGFGSTGTIHLANTSNTITANNVTAGDNSRGTSNLFLGAGTNTFNLGGALIIGNGIASGNVQFETSSGSIAINGLDPVNNPTQVPNITVSNTSSQGGATTSRLSLAGHNASIQAGTVTVGVVSGLGNISTGIVTFDTGTFNVQTLNFAVHPDDGLASSTAGIFTLGGPTPDVVSSGVLNVSTALNLANRANGSTSFTDSGTFIINGGTANINADIVDASTSNAGPRTTTLTLAGGTLNVMGHAIGSTTAPITNVNLVAGGGQATLKNLGGAGINGNGLTLNGQGLLNLDGINNYSGNTTINFGTLSVIGAITGGSGTGTVNINGGSLIGNGNLNTSGFIGEPVNVNGGAIRAGTTPGDVGQLAMTGLTFNGGGLIVDLGPSLTADRLVDNGPLAIGGTAASPISLTVTGTYATGTYEIIDYTGPLTFINNSSVFRLSGPLGFQFVPDFSITGKVFLHVSTDPNVLIWNGAVNASWDTSTPNFRKGGVNVPYSDPSPVSFTDMSPSSATTINISGGIAPSIVSVASSINNFTFQGGPITGAGSLVKDGASTLTILNDNTYAGGTTINNGIVQVGNGGATGSLGTGAITNNGILAYNRSGIVVVANTITGTGTVQKLGAGNLILTANNSYGATTISAGTLQIGNGGNSGSLGSGPITVNAGGTLSFNRSDNVNLANSISGSGTLSILGPGTLTFSGTNTLTGGVAVGPGGIYSTNFLPSASAAGGGGGVSPAAALPVGAIVLTGGTLQYTGTAVTSSDSLTLGPPGGTLDASGAANAAMNLSNTAAVAFSSSTSPITLTLTGASTGANTLAAAINNAGTGANVTSVVKNGAGTWVLSGADSYTGGTTVNHGTLRMSFTGGAVMGAVAAMVNNDATLEVANSTPALSHTPVINNSTAAAGLLISGTCLEIRSIDGPGATQVNAGGEVTTDHIIQSALTILGTQLNPSTVTIAASDPAGNPLASDSDAGPLGGAAPSLSSGPFASNNISSANSISSLSGNPALVTSANSSAAGNPSSVPEPSTLLLALAAVVGLTVRKLVPCSHAERASFL